MTSGRSAGRPRDLADGPGASDTTDKRGQWHFFSSQFGHHGDERCFVRIIGHRSRRTSRVGYDWAQAVHEAGRWAITWFHESLHHTFAGRASRGEGHHLLIMPPGDDSHRIPVGQPFLHSWMGVLGTGFGEVVGRVGLPIGAPVPVRDPGRFEQRWIALRDELSAHREQDSGVVLLHFELMMSELWRDVQVGEEHHLPPAIRQVQELIVAQRDGRLSVEAIACQLGCSSRQLLRDFRRHCACSLQHFHHRLRMERACELLADPGMDLGAVAAAIGYGDAFAFSKAFKKQIGMSPSDWRRG